MHGRCDTPPARTAPHPRLDPTGPSTSSSHRRRRRSPSARPTIRLSIRSRSRARPSGRSIGRPAASSGHRPTGTKRTGSPALPATDRVPVRWAFPNRHVDAVDVGNPAEHKQEDVDQVSSSGDSHIDVFLPDLFLPLYPDPPVGTRSIQSRVIDRLTRRGPTASGTQVRAIGGCYGQAKARGLAISIGVHTTMEIAAVFRSSQ